MLPLFSRFNFFMKKQVGSKSHFSSTKVFLVIGSLTLSVKQHIFQAR